MAWETFERRRWRSPGEPTITLTNTGRIALNAAVVNDFVKDNRFAILMFDRERQLIGIKFTKSADATSYPVSVNDRKSGGAITGTAFLKFYNVFPGATKNYKATYDREAKALVIDISHEGAGGKRSKRMKT